MPKSNFHGHARRGQQTGEYTAWRNAIYSGRADVCPEWRESFVTFLDDMGSKPSAKHVLRRIDREKGYTRNNCEWAPRWAVNQGRPRDRGGRSRFQGVSWHEPTQKWRAEIMSHGRRYHLGYFGDEEDAALAYNDKARMLHGRYAQLNRV